VYRDYINNLAKRGVISYEAAANRIMLVEVMHEAGLYPYRREWWHYEEIISITATRSKYKLLDF
jgi:D-alanyl-D-alanine dipeptidase